MLVVVVVVGVCVALASGCISVCRRSDSHCQDEGVVVRSSDPHCQDEGVVVVLFSTNVWVGCGLPYICTYIYVIRAARPNWLLLVMRENTEFSRGVLCVGLFVFAAVSAK